MKEIKFFLKVTGREITSIPHDHFLLFPLNWESIHSKEDLDWDTCGTFYVTENGIKKLTINNGWRERKGKKRAERSREMEQGKGFDYEVI